MINLVMHMHRRFDSLNGVSEHPADPENIGSNNEYNTKCMLQNVCYKTEHLLFTNK